MTTNYAKFTINGIASVDSENNAGVNVTNGQTITLTLETNPAPVLSVTYYVYDPNDASSPTKSKDAPNITFNGSATAAETLTSPNGSVSIDMPDSGIHSYVIRCVASLGVSATDHTYERLVAIKSATVPQLRKTVPNETNQYDQDGWSDELNDMVDAINSVSGGLYDDFYGDAISSKWAVSVGGTGAVDIEQNGAAAACGIVSLYIDRDGGSNSATINSTATQFHRGLSPTIKGYFKLSVATEVVWHIGFWIDASNYVVLDVDSFTNGNFRFKSRNGGVNSFVSTGVLLDTDFHTFEIRFNGLTGYAEMIFDGDTSNVLSISDSYLPATDYYAIDARQTSSSSVLGDSTIYIDYISAIQQRRSS
jgi:hypothetical protein